MTSEALRQAAMRSAVEYLAEVVDMAHRFGADQLGADRISAHLATRIDERGEVLRSEYGDAGVTAFGAALEEAVAGVARLVERDSDERETGEGVHDVR